MDGFQTDQNACEFSFIQNTLNEPYPVLEILGMVKNGDLLIIIQETNFGETAR
jgi:hypothetical protein